MGGDCYSNDSCGSERWNAGTRGDERNGKESPVNANETLNFDVNRRSDHINGNDCSQSGSSSCYDPWLEARREFEDTAKARAVLREERARVRMVEDRDMYGTQSLNVAADLILIGDACDAQQKRSESANYYKQAGQILVKNGKDDLSAAMLEALAEREDSHEWSRPGIDPASLRDQQPLPIEHCYPPDSYQVPSNWHDIYRRASLQHVLKNPEDAERMYREDRELDRPERK